MIEVSKCVPERALFDLESAYANYFNSLKKNGHKVHRPQFKKKGKTKDSFYVKNDLFKIEGNKIRIPKLGWVKMCERLRFNGKVIGATISRTADRWFVAIQVEVEADTVRRKNNNSVGIDLGINRLATLSTGKFFNSPKAFTKNLKKLRRLNKSVSRKALGGSNRKKAIVKLARLHARIANIRSDYTHKITANIVRKYRFISIEDLAVSNLLKNHKLARSLSDVGLGEFRRQIEYKSVLYNSKIVKIDRFYPSSKVCRKCKHKNQALTLANRVFVCPSCGHREDRDLHAARNILREGLRTAGTAETYACEQGSAMQLVCVRSLDEARRVAILSKTLEENIRVSA